MAWGHLWDFRPSTDSAVDGHQIAFGDDQA